MGYALTINRPGTALVLGGSGGAGAEIAQALARAGSSVALTYNTNLVKAKRVAAAIEAEGAPSSTWKLDLTDTASTSAIIGEIASQHSGLHTLVHAVGPIFTWGSIGEIAPQELKQSLSIETAGFHAALYAALPHLRRAKGSIVACTTWANRRVMPGDGLSSIPKAAIDSMVRQVAREEAEHLVRANIVSVGSFDMGMGSTKNERNMVSGISQEQWAAMLRQIPLGERLGRGEELAAAVVFLASDQASYVTGQTIIVDGGLSL